MTSLRTVSFHTLGCKLNYAETATFRRAFAEAGYSEVDFGAPADVALINTCSVTAAADREARQLVRRVLRRAPDTYVVVAGCYAQLRPEEIASIDGVDLVLGNAEKFRAVEFLDPALAKGRTRVFAAPVDDEPGFGTAFAADQGHRTRAFLKVQDGCDYPCSYCTIPLARGGSRSLPLDAAVEQARGIIAAGFREIVLSGVNVGDYGARGGPDFASLLRALLALEGDFRIRIPSIEPNLLTDEIVDLAAAHPKLCRHFHVPLQAGSDGVLRIMRRRYTIAQFRGRIARVLETVPEAGIGIDVIVGMPGETRALFEEGYRFLADLPFAYLHVFSYSERPGTAAASMPDPVSAPERAERSAMLRALSDRRRRLFHESQLGATLDVLCETGAGAVVEGFAGNYARVRLPYAPRLEHEMVRARALRLAEDGVIEGEADAAAGYVALPLLGDAAGADARAENRGAR